MGHLPDPQLASVLSVPLRRRILDLIDASDRGVSVSELTAELGCNHNAVRQHLARLEQAGLVRGIVEAPGRRGRPRRLYRATPTPDVYARLARLLLALRAQRDAPRTVGRRQGRADAAIVATTDPVDALEADAREYGFSPRRITRGRRVDLVLESCPLADAAVDDPRTVCALHRGLAEGLVEGVGGAQVERFIARDPRTAGCRVQVRRTS